MLEQETRGTAVKGRAPRLSRRLVVAAGAALPLCAIGGRASRAASDMVIARQPGLSDFALMVVEEKGLLDRRLSEMGAGDVKPRWTKMASVPAMVDSLLSGSAHVVQSGVPALLTLWTKTTAANKVKGVAVASRMPYLLNTRNPQIKSLLDFTEHDKIAVPGVKISAQAIVLQMAAEQAFGAGNHEKLDPLTVTIPNTEAMAALLSGKSEITAHFAPAPYQTEELRDQAIRTVLSSYDVFGGPTSGGIVISTQRYFESDPRPIQALQLAMADAMALINADKVSAAALYLQLSGEKSTPERIRAAMDRLDYEMVPKNVMKYASFMHRTGRIAQMPSALDDIFLPSEFLKDGS
jgi:NitT/TauT family transport system substrate-binding protein